MKRIILKNTIQIIYQKNPSSNTVYLEAGFLAGLFSAKIEKRQIPHILEHLILRNFTSKNSEFQKNGKTNNLLTTFSFESTAESFEKTLNEFVSLFENFNFTENDLRIQKNVVKNEIITSTKGNPEIYTEILKNQNIPALNSIEEVETLSKITKNDILDFFKNYFSAKNLRILAVGNFDENKIIEAFENIKLPQEKPATSQDYKLKNAKILKNNEKVCFYTQIFTLNRYLNSIERVTTELILNEVEIKIYQALRKNGLAYNFKVFFSEGSILNNSFLAFESKFESSTIAKVEENIEKEIAKIQKISEKDFKNAKNRLQNKLIFKMQTPTQIGQKQRIRALIYGDFINFELINKIKIEDFQNLAKEFFS
ncbi:insulinase family protein [Candidatus Saccharibacteria bacterium]|nr:insulinase family protein [Candidatus Saccharibacteria bacterium]